jgi:peptidoglycan/LPS O-acetylase OafA/YrhL
MAALCFLITSLVPTFRPDWHSLWFNLVGYSMVAFMATAWIAFTLFHENALQSRLLAHPALVLLGLISYEFYLYHELVLKMAQMFLTWIAYNHMRTVLPLTLLVILSLSYLSYRFFDLPLMRWGKAQAVQLTLRARGEHH